MHSNLPLFHQKVSVSFFFFLQRLRKLSRPDFLIFCNAFRLKNQNISILEQWETSMGGFYILKDHTFTPIPSLAMTLVLLLVNKKNIILERCFIQEYQVQVNLCSITDTEKKAQPYNKTFYNISETAFSFLLLGHKNKSKQSFILLKQVISHSVKKIKKKNQQLCIIY